MDLDNKVSCQSNMLRSTRTSMEIGLFQIHDNQYSGNLIQSGVQTKHLQVYLIVDIHIGKINALLCLILDYMF